MRGDRVHDESVPADYNVFLYVLDGSGQVGFDRREVKAGQVIWLDNPQSESISSIQLRSGAAGMRILLAGGRPLHEPVVARGPFVMNTHEQIAQAYEDYRSGTFGT